jgi:hypothetical protein
MIQRLYLFQQIGCGMHVSCRMQPSKANLLKLPICFSNVLWAFVACLQPASNLYIYKHALGAFVPSTDHLLKWQTSPTKVLWMTGKIAKGKEHTIMTYHKWSLQQRSIGHRETTLPYAATPETKILLWKESTQVELIIKQNCECARRA